LEHILFDRPDYGKQIAELAGAQYNPKGSMSIARVRDGLLLGGVVYYHMTGESVAVHVAGSVEHWLNRDLLWVVFDFPFSQLGVKRLFGEISEDNQAALKFNENLGFHTVARIEGVFPNNVACIVRRLDREDCRFLTIKPRTIGRRVH
jgi:RimJ/RimL family protein N-acetyltransferase